MLLKHHPKDTTKAQSFIDSLTEEERIVLIMYWLAGDGHVFYTYINQGTALSFSRLSISSRDEQIPILFQQAMQRFGFYNTTIMKEDTHVAHTLIITKDDEFYEAVVNALEMIPVECLHGKLHYILQVLKAGSQGISLAQGPPRTLSFFNYLGNAKEDRLACLIAHKDLYSLTLFEINRILAYGGVLDQIEDTRDLDFGTLLNHVANLRDREELTPEEVSNLSVPKSISNIQ